jgi:hypothetical protein
VTVPSSLFAEAWVLAGRGKNVRKDSSLSHTSPRNNRRSILNLFQKKAHHMDEILTQR